MIKKIINSRKLLAITVILITVIIGIGAAQPAHAAFLSVDLGTIAISFFNNVLEIFLNNILAPTLAFVASGLQIAIALSTTAITENVQIKELWGLIRDLVNMVFILALLVIAFGTIFDTQYGAKHALFKLITVALLINFSYVIGAIVIEFSNIMASAFIGIIGNPAEVSNRMAQSIQPGSFYPDSGAIKQLENLRGAVEVAGQVLASLFFSIIFMLLSIIAMFVGFILIIMRIPVLWVILIFAPVAWAGYIFPQTKRQTWDIWWGKLIEWSFVLPVYMFFLFLGVYFLNNSALNVEQTALMGSYTITDYLLGVIMNNVGRLFQFILAISFLFGGAFAAKKVCGEAGAQVGKVQDWMEGKIRKSAAGSTVGAAWGKFKETGQIGSSQTIYGGARAQRLREARGRNIVNPGEKEAARAKEVEAEMNSLRARKLTMTKEAWAKEAANLGKGGDINSLAVKQLLAEEGKAINQDGQIVGATEKDMVSFFKQAGGDRTPTAEKYLASMSKSGALGRIDQGEAIKIINGGENSEAKNMLRFKQMLGKALVKSNPNTALDVSKSMLKILPAGEQRDAYLKDIDWSKSAGSVKFAEKQKALTQIQSMKSSLDPEQFKAIEENLKKHNPALWAEAVGEDASVVISEHMRDDTPEEMKKYIKNVWETNRSDVSNSIASMDEEEFKNLIKGQSKEFIEQLRLTRR